MATTNQAPFVPRENWLRYEASAEGDFSIRFLLGMVLLGAILRLLALNGQSLWVDEILTWHAVRPGMSLEFWEQVRDTIQGPLYLAVIWPLVHARDTELMLRLPATVAGILAVPVFGVLAFRLVNGRAARLALLLFALNPFHIWYSQEGRGYAFLVLFTLVAALLYFTMVRRGPSPGSVIGFAAAGVAMVLSNLSGAFLLLAMAATLFLFHRPVSLKDRGLWLLAFGLIGLLSAPWLLRASGIWAVDRIVPGAGTGVALRGMTTFSPLAVPYAVFSFFFGYSLGPSLRELHQPDRLAVLMGYLPLLLAGAASVGGAVIAGLTRPDRRLATFVVWILLPVAVAVLLAMRNIKPWNPRYVMVALPWLLLVAGLGLARLSRRWGALLAMALVGLTMWSLVGYYGNHKYAKADLRAASAWIGETVPADQAVLVPVVTGVFEYYDRGVHELISSYGRPMLTDQSLAGRFVRESLAGRDSCQVVLAREWFFDPDGFLLPALAQAGTLELAAIFPGVEIYAWHRRATESSLSGTGSRNDL